MYVDENDKAFYLDGFANGIKHDLKDYTVVNGVPTLSWDGRAFSEFITPGDVGMKEPGSKSGAGLSDLIRFPDAGPHPKKRPQGARSLLFYSDKESTGYEPDNDAGIPTNTASTIDEIELGKLPLTLPGGIDPKLDLSGRWGSVYLPRQTDPGGLPPSRGPIAYIFVSDTDQAISKGKSVHYDAGSSRYRFRTISSQTPDRPATPWWARYSTWRPSASPERPPTAGKYSTHRLEGR